MRPTRLVPLLLLIASIGLEGCQYLQPNQQTRGNMVDEIDYGQLVAGTSTRADVTSLIGSPTTRATFDDDTWIYVGMRTQPTIGGFPAISRQQVLVLNFDANGTLRSIHRSTEKDAVQVAMDGRTTPSPGSEASVLQQVIGNVGRYNPAGLLGGGSGANPNGAAGGQGGAGNTLP